MRRLSQVNVVLQDNVAAPRGPVTGRLVRVDEQGQAWVDWADGMRAQPARITRSAAAWNLRDPGLAGAPVLLVFAEDGAAVIVDLIEERVVDAEALAAIAAPSGEVRNPIVASVDGKSVTLRAEDEIVLSCGEASLTLRRNGRVVIRGAYVETRSSGVNRIKGGSVRIN
jgi:hypothetical protein